jgi:hypothetical protein
VTPRDPATCDPVGTSAHYAPPRAPLLDLPEDGARVRARLLRWGVGTGVLLTLVAGFMFWLTGVYGQMFTAFGTRLSAPTSAVMDMRYAWFALPTIALTLTVAAWRYKSLALDHRRRILGALIALTVASMGLAGVAWYLMIWAIYEMAEKS